MNGSPGYVLSKKALDTITNYRKETDKLLLDELYEDKLIGDILRLNDYEFTFHGNWLSMVKSYNMYWWEKN